MLAILSLIFMALVVAAVVSVGALIVRAAFWALLLPFKVLFAVLSVPFWIAK